MLVERSLSTPKIRVRIQLSANFKYFIEKTEIKKEAGDGPSLKEESDKKNCILSLIGREPVHWWLEKTEVQQVVNSAPFFPILV